MDNLKDIKLLATIIKIVKHEIGNLKEEELRTISELVSDLQSEVEELHNEELVIPKGAPGPKGNKGDIGPKGDKGDTGDVGAPGPKGDKGDIGPKGDKGDTGPKGDPGKDGLEADATPFVTALEQLKQENQKFVENIPSLIPPAIEGAVGPKGDKGDTGPKGDKGDIGLTGAVGPKGDKGDIGPKGDTGLTGVTGPKGDIGPKGDVGPAGALGPKGDTGPKGDKGDTGPKGDTGLTGDTGPKGDKGDKGDIGPKGDTGPQGIPGEPAPIKDITKKSEFENFRREYNTYKTRLNQQLSSLGGGGSVRVLDSEDVVFNKPQQLTTNDILVWNSNLGSQGKFESLNITDVINKIRVELEVQYDKLVEETAANGITTTYVGEAAPGTTKSDSVWRIKRITEDSNGNIEIAWANDTELFDKTWNDRNTYNYVI